jgi:phosphoribosylformylglycinamidine (FGAM) synthase PurS component
MDEIDLQLAKEYGENVGRVRTAKWIKFLFTYKSEKEILKLLDKLISRECAADSRLAKLDRY